VLTTLASLFASSGFGALIGLLGSWLTKREERKNLQLKYDYDLKIAEVRKAEAAAEAAHELAMADKQIERAQVEGDIAKDIKETDAFIESLKEQTQVYGVKWVDALRGIMRPLITIYLLALATIVTLAIGKLVGGLQSLEQTELLTIYKSVINQMVFLATTAVTWWFGSRPSSQRKG